MNIQVIASNKRQKLVCDDAENYIIVTEESEQIPVQILINRDKYDKDGLVWFISESEDLYIKYRSNLWNGKEFLKNSGYSIKKNLRNVYTISEGKWVTVKADTVLILDCDPYKMLVTLS